MATARKVLLADPDVGAIRALTKALRARGYQVQHAPDGSKALEVSVLRHPDVILFDETCTLIEARSFIQILGSNPRTEDIPVVVTTTSRDLDKFRQLREGVLQKPFNIDEVIARIDHLCRRVEAAHELRGDAREIEGGLAQHDQARQLLSPQRDLRMWLRFHRSAANCRLDAGITEGVGEMLRMSATGLEIMGNAGDGVELRQARARLALAEGRIDESIAIIESIITDPVLENPSYGRGTSELILAEALVEAGRAAEAAEHFASAARIYESEGRLKQSIDAWQKAAESGFVEKNLTPA